MKYGYSVIYGGRFYKSGDEVPVEEKKTTKATTAKAENKAAKSEKTDNEEATAAEAKKDTKSKAKA